MKSDPLSKEFAKTVQNAARKGYMTTLKEDANVARATIQKVNQTKLQEISISRLHSIN
jgi:DNA-binding Xre family transcriptional regulator